MQPGTRIGSYEVIAPIGAGGMGEVCRARDTTLKRDVAFKMLPGLMAADAERLARFTRVLVAEYVEGEDHSGRLTRGPLPLDETLVIAKQQHATPRQDRLVFVLDFAEELRGIGAR